jgi:hypothetical protein
VNKTERDDLIRLARMRAKLAKSDADQRVKVLLAEAEDLMAGEFEARDQLWVEAEQVAEEACRKANEVIVARCADLGIPAKYAPQLELGWRSRSREFASTARRAELRKVAATRLAALAAAAKNAIDRKVLETETALIAGSLESGDARAFLAAMPTAEQLMPPLGLDDLGVKTWQPPEGAAAALLTPSTPADRRRRKVLRAIEAHPGASDREVGRLAGVDGKTVAAYRLAAAELPAQAAEFRTEDEEDL